MLQMRGAPIKARGPSTWSGAGGHDWRWGINKFVREKKKTVKARGPSEKRGPGQLPRLPCPKFAPASSV